MRIGVVIPTLNEEQRIGSRLSELAAMGDIHNVVVADGGSTDDTCVLARTFAGVEVIAARRGRGPQMNAGAAVLSRAGIDAIVFLHADVSLPVDAPSWVNRTLSDPSTVAGAFRTSTVAEARRPFWAPALALADMRSRYTSLPYGDQALFVRCEDFFAAGGFPDQPLMEDWELSRRLSRRGRIRVVPACVRVSGRRFIERPLFFTLVVNLFPLLYRAGVSPATLKRLYADIR